MEPQTPFNDHDHQPPPSLMTLPPEIRQQIYTDLFAHIALIPSPSLVPTPTTPLRKQPCTHPCLALLATNHLIHAEAYPELVRAASITLRTPAQYALHVAATTTAADQQQQQQQRQQVRRPTPAEVQRLVLAWPLLCARASSSSSSSSSAADAMLSSNAMPALRELVVAGIEVGVAHVRLVRLWAGQQQQQRRAGGFGIYGGPNGEMPLQEETRLLLVQGLMCELTAEECDLLLGVLGAARGKWRVQLGWRVRCSTCRAGQGQGQGQGQDWAGCRVGVVGVQVGIEV